MLENTILFIGLGENKNKLNKILEIKSSREAERIYGLNTCFYKACSEAEFIGAEKIFCLNLNAWEDLQELQEIIKDLEFNYIVPINLHLTDNYYNPIYNKVITYTQLLMLAVRNSAVTNVIMCGKHASAFETLDDYLKYEEQEINKITPALGNLSKENIIYVANNLANYEYSNVVLASLLATSDYAVYPSSGNIGPAVFDIEFCDVKTNLAFFKNNFITGTTIENLVNFSTDETKKLVIVNKILSYFQWHKPDTEQFIGTAYTDYKKVAVTEILQEYLESLVGYIITKYEIDSVTDSLSENGTVDITLNYTVWPKFTTERYLLTSNV